MKKIVLFRFFAVSMGLLTGSTCFLLLSEVFLRCNQKFTERYSSFKFREPNFKASEYKCRRPSALLGYELVPNNPSSHTNKYGMVSTEYPLKKEKRVFRVLLLGDSIAEQGWSAERLEELLNNNSLLRSKYRFELWNAGCGSYDARRYATYLQYKGLRYNPDMIIIFLFMNDFNSSTCTFYKDKNEVMRYDFPIPEVDKYYRIDPFLVRNSYLYRFIIFNIERYLENKSKPQPGLHPDEENGRYYLSVIRNICLERKIPLFVVIFPYLKKLDDYYDWQKSQFSTISKVVTDLKMDYLNLYSLYNSLLKENFNMWDQQDDDIHPSKELSRLIAHEIYHQILVTYKFFDR